MQKPALVLDVMICHPSYGGNGGLSSEHPDIREWACETLLKMKQDPRIGNIYTKTIADTPITMVRNKFVTLARQHGAHLLLMVDSDQSPNRHKGESWFKPFWEVAFDEIYAHYQRGPLVIGAPYCGPPNGLENVYVFQFSSDGTGRGDETQFQLDQYTRAQAAVMSGIQECAALPTGMILYDMRAFDLIEPTELSKEQILDQLLAGKITKRDAARLMSQGWFYYEWSSGYADEKASTEDVTNTRDIALAGVTKLGYNPLRCAWDSWVGHHKPWNVGKPAVYKVEQVGETLRRAVESNVSAYERVIDPAEGKPIADRLRELGIYDAEIHVASGAIADQNGQIGISPDLPTHVTPTKHLDGLARLVKDRVKWLEVAGRADVPPLKVIEIGSWMGHSAIAMADTGLARVLCVDTFKGSPTDHTGRIAKAYGGSVRDAFEKNIGGRLGKSIRDWQCDSQTAARLAKDVTGFHSPYLPADIVFIDADHSYESTKADILAWLPHVAADGVMIGHDYHTEQFPGVDRAVHEIFGDLAKPYVWSQDCGGFWLVEISEYRKRQCVNSAMEASCCGKA